MCIAGFGRHYEKHYSCSLCLHLYPHVAELVVSWKKVIVVSMVSGRAWRQIHSVRIGRGFSVSWISSMENDTDEKVFHPR